MDRRAFLGASLAAGAAAAGALAKGGIQEASAVKNRGFKLKYAPHFGMFRQHAGEDPLEQLKFMADQGFTALEDNGMAGRPPAEQEKIAREMARLNLTMGVFVAYADFGAASFVLDNEDVRTMLRDTMQKAVEVARRVNAQWTTVVPGAIEHRLAWEYQTANCVENLKRCADICAPAGLTMVLEPLNFRDHPNLFLTRVPQGYQICRAVGSPACKILNDLYHQQVTEGNLIPNIDAAWREIAYFQVGDNPGRREPTTGEINYRNVFRHLHQRGYTGIIGMEHGIAGEGKAGEEALLAAYRACDDF